MHYFQSGGFRTTHDRVDCTAGTFLIAPYRANHGLHNTAMGILTPITHMEVDVCADGHAKTPSPGPPALRRYAGAFRRLVRLCLEYDNAT
jgi:hypothetical protein